MEDRTKKALSWLIVLALVAALGGVAACTSSSDDDESTETETSETNGDETEDDESDDTASDPSDAELEDGAIDISKAYFGQFSAVGDSSMADFTVAAMVEDSEGNWWARVTATPDDPSMETEQIYVKLEPGNEVWFTIDMGTGIDPATDDRFPEDVQDELQP